ncbi:MAG: nonstructural protein [Microvirus sp.]|nr:MAG: nonstructural protein [Microvirus sp.]
MILRAYSVFDKKLVCYSRPWFVLNDAVAVREFGDAVNDPNPSNQWRKHPEDFTLCNLGNFDDSTGEFIPISPEHVIHAAALVRGPDVESMKVVN